MNGNAQFIYESALCQRVRDLRDARGWTQMQMATALDIPYERYKKYETRSPLPHYLLERFALLVGQDLHYVVTGKRAPVQVVLPESRSKPKRA